MVLSGTIAHGRFPERLTRWVTLSSLVAWHYLDPPDEFERRRNHTIYSQAYNPSYYTNNRNAFVDRPEFVWSIYVDQQNDSSLTISGGTMAGDGTSTLDLDFGPVIVGAPFPQASRHDEQGRQ